MSMFTGPEQIDEYAQRFMREPSTADREEMVAYLIRYGGCTRLDLLQHFRARGSDTRSSEGKER